MLVEQAAGGLQLHIVQPYFSSCSCPFLSLPSPSNCSRRHAFAPIGGSCYLHLGQGPPPPQSPPLSASPSLSVLCLSVKTSRDLMHLKDNNQQTPLDPIAFPVPLPPQLKLKKEENTLSTYLQSSLLPTSIKCLTGFPLVHSFSTLLPMSSPP